MIMASEENVNIDSCIYDPNFAIVCSFFEKFSALCGIKQPNFANLQQMLDSADDGEYESGLPPSRAVFGGFAWGGKKTAINREICLRFCSSFAGFGRFVHTFDAKSEEKR